jgi:hypothetical protein
MKFEIKKLEFMQFSSCLYAFASNFDFDFDFLIRKLVDLFLISGL